MQQRIPRRDPLGRIQLQTFVQQIHKLQQLLQFVVFHLDLHTRGRQESRAEIASGGVDDERFQRVLPHQLHPMPHPLSLGTDNEKYKL